MTLPVRPLGALFAAAALAGGLFAAAPTAAAATTASCSEAWVSSLGPGYMSQTFNTPAGYCTFADQGAPYTFVIPAMHVTALFVNPPYHYSLSNVTATCTTAYVNKATLTTNGCTYVH